MKTFSQDWINIWTWHIKESKRQIGNDYEYQSSFGFRSALGCGDWFLHSRHWSPLSVHLLRDCGIHSRDQLQCFDQLESISNNSATTFQSNANIMQLYFRQYNTDLFIPDCGGKSLPMANTYWHWEDSCIWEVGGFVQGGGALICRSRVRATENSGEIGGTENPPTPPLRHLESPEFRNSGDRGFLVQKSNTSTLVKFPPVGEILNC